MCKTMCLFVAAIVVSSSFGCGSNEMPRAHLVDVHGKVTVDGEPLQDGSIEFIDPSGKSESAIGAIQGGEYRLKSAPGSKRVEIRAQKTVSERTNAATGQTEKITEQILPEKFNAKSELKADIPTGAAHDAPFDLKTK